MLGTTSTATKGSWQGGIPVAEGPGLKDGSEVLENWCRCVGTRGNPDEDRGSTSYGSTGGGELRTLCQVCVCGVSIWPLLAGAGEVGSGGDVSATSASLPSPDSGVYAPG